MNKIFKFFSAFIVLLMGFTGCDTIVETSSVQPKSPKQSQQVIIEESTPSKPNTEQTQQQTQQQNQYQTEVQQQQQNQNQNEEQTAEMPEKTEYQASSAPTEKTKSPPFLNWGETNNQYWTKLKTVAEAATTFYQNNGNRFTLLSKGGKLYSSSNDCYITTNYLKNNGFLEQDFSEFLCDILLINGCDIANYIDIDMPSSSLNIGIFTAIKQPSGNKIMLSSSTDKIASISEEDYSRLLKQYDAYHGSVNVLSPEMEEYERILNFIRVYEGNYDKYYVRDIRMDKKYAVVTFSTQNAPNNIKQYVLVNKDGFWEVAINNLDKQSNLYFAVNSILPDFNLSLLPPYNVYFYKNDMKADFSDVLKNMVFYEMIEQQSQVRYICGTTNYCYIILYGNEHYLGKKINDDWDIKKVQSASDAIQSMQLNNKNAPTFIVLDE
ncbi:hypothetical protein [Clostridium sp. MD294]|uniref:hypothetical protein n=2 Tax=Clostridium sp. MD294 TaxID=97138 RepID=UPI0002CB73DF|nr:hypothetical protein [Clostridium sp. MD294]NDO46770.1 hypothetical protein [Clostridium sp. MD294]